MLLLCLGTRERDSRGERHLRAPVLSCAYYFKATQANYASLWAMEPKAIMALDGT